MFWNLLAEATGRERALNIGLDAAQWVLFALSLIGAVVIGIFLVFAGINFARAENGEARKKARNRLLGCLFGLIVVVGAAIVVPLVTPLIKEVLIEALS